jgi:hypothetical protein
LSASGEGTFIIAPSLEALTSAFSQLDNTEITIQKVRTVNRRRSLSFQILILAVILLASIKFIRRYFLGAIV